MHEVLCVSWLLIGFVLLMQASVGTPEPPPAPVARMGGFVKWLTGVVGS